MLELGAFALFNMLGFGTMAYGTQSTLPLAKPFALLSIMAFIILSFWMLQPEDIGTVRTSVISDGATTWNDTTESVWISDEFTNMLQWVYFGLSFLAFLVFATKVLF